ncbi:uncharacterized protein FN964_016790 isoform 1-T1 [Alca torda]
MAAPMESGSPILCPAEPCQQNADLAKAEEQKAAASFALRRGRRAKGFHRPPAAERRLSINACLTNKPAIRLRLQVTLSSTKAKNICCISQVTIPVMQMRALMAENVLRF